MQIRCPFTFPPRKLGRPRNSTGFENGCLIDGNPATSDAPAALTR